MTGYCVMRDAKQASGMNSSSKSLEHFPSSGTMWVMRPAVGVLCVTVCWGPDIPPSSVYLLAVPRLCCLSYVTLFRSIYFFTFILILSPHLRNCSKQNNRSYDWSVSWMCIVYFVHCPSYSLWSKHPNNIYIYVYIVQRDTQCNWTD